MSHTRTYTACPVCGERYYYDGGISPSQLKRETHTDEGVLLEASEVCGACGLYANAYAYGGTWEAVGWVEDSWGHDEPPAEAAARRETRAEAVLEAKVIFAHPDWLPVWRPRLESPAADETDRLVFADWLDDINCPTNAVALRAAVLAARQTHTRTYRVTTTVTKDGDTQTPVPARPH